MAERLAKISGRFILLINDVPQVRGIFRDFAVEEVSLSYGVSAAGATRARELIIQG
jgi:DNA adenine methylase